LYFSCMLHACYLLFIMCLCMSVKSSTELMLYVVLTMPTLNKAYLYLFIYIYGQATGKLYHLRRYLI
jgi:hypothetical protein